MNRNLLKEFLQKIKRIAGQIRKEWEWFVHDRLSVSILFLLPIFLVVIIGIGNFTITSVSGTPIVYIIDQDGSQYSHAYIETFNQSKYFNMEIHDSYSEPTLVSLQNAQDLISKSQIDAYIIIPANFTDNLLENRSTNIILISDANSQSNSLIKQYFSMGNLLFQMKYQVFNGEIVYNPEFRPNEEFSFIIMVLPVLLSLLLFVCTNLVASQCIIADDPLKRMLLTPTRRDEVIIAKSFAYSFLGMVLSFICVFILQVFFHINFSSFLNTFLLCSFATIFGVNYGVLFSSLAKTRLQAAQLSLFFFVIQFVIGIFVRIEPIVYYLPIDIIRKSFSVISFRGAAFHDIPGLLSGILIHNLIIIIIAILLYKQKKYAV
ncbi:MAG: ABC transporter permease [Promethearchaeota archaeon]